MLAGFIFSLSPAQNIDPSVTAYHAKIILKKEKRKEAKKRKREDAAKRKEEARIKTNAQYKEVTSNVNSPKPKKRKARKATQPAVPSANTKNENADKND